MKTIVTQGGAFRTGTEIADAVTGYGLALARIRELDTVDIPFIAGDGAVNRVQFRVGWLIDTVVTSDEQAADELIEADTIFALLAKAKEIDVPREKGSATHYDRFGDGFNWDEVI